MSLSDAIRCAFEPNAEPLSLVWNEVPISIGWSHPFDQMIRSLVPMVSRLLAEPAGGGAYGIHDNLLSFEWKLEWSEGRLSIESLWFAPAGLESELAGRTRLEMPVQEFVAEWKMPFRIAIEAIASVAIEPDAGGVDPRAELSRVEAAIPRFGRLYAQEAP